jgi:hypothetical protein
MYTIVGTPTKQRMRISRNVRRLFLISALCCLPAFAADSPADPELSPFGIGACAARSNNLESWLPQMSAIGLKVLRTPSQTGWPGYIKNNGKWDSLDDRIAYVEKNGFVTGGMFQGAESKEHVGYLPTYNLPGWARYVESITAHTKGKIKYWAAFNEPPNGTHGAPPADLAKAIVATYDAAKKGNPDCKIGLSVKSVDLNYLAETIKAGAKGHFDYISLHPYETLGAAAFHPNTEAIFMAIRPTVRKMLADLDPQNADAPIWFTEIGCDAGKKGPDLQAHALVKAYTMSIAQGITVVNWFEGRDGDSGPMGLIDMEGKPRPAYTALAQMIKHFGLHPEVIGWTVLNDKDYAFLFKGAQGPVMVTWAPFGTTDTVNFGQAFDIVEPLTGKTTKASEYKLTEAPIIVLGAPEKLLAEARIARTRPFPWGGDYTNAQSVSITMGQKTVEKGLHTQAGDSFAADVLAYGGNARAGEGIQGGNVFIIDPNFLSYTSSPTPIEITVVARPAPSVSSAKLVLEYESPSQIINGYKKLAAQELHDNKDWHTITWKINDAQFVGKYGFHFRLDQGKYFIQSVTVAKLAAK